VQYVRGEAGRQGVEKRVVGRKVVGKLLTECKAVASFVCIY
jgi:hypothetical protein